jgi:hypothetical protein
MLSGFLIHIIVLLARLDLLCCVFRCQILCFSLQKKLLNKSDVLSEIILNNVAAGRWPGPRWDLRNCVEAVLIGGLDLVLFGSHLYSR